eukprot:TRINITY_DN39670_c0_g1_i1.p1 TRINITY_DN39670_c0_g1~~TRINITY_DN39670_c0_g1_i1.p1  ORF type:complete len:288 (-),score=52.69 TRINITY_DN39670_c0_g1_i1:439-1302(-)
MVGAFGDSHHGFDFARSIAVNTMSPLDKGAMSEDCGNASLGYTDGAPPTDHDEQFAQHGWRTDESSRHKSFQDPRPGRRGDSSNDVVRHGHKDVVACSLDTVVEEDRRLSRLLRSEVDDLSAQLAELEAACRETQAGTLQEQMALQHSEQQREQALRRVEASRLHVAELAKERRVLEGHGVSLLRNHEHCRKEVTFLQGLLHESLRDTQALQVSVETLEQSSCNLVEHTRALESVRRDLSDQLLTEQKHLDEERMRANEVGEQLKACRDRLNSSGVPVDLDSQEISY